MKIQNTIKKALWILTLAASLSACGNAEIDTSASNELGDNESSTIEEEVSLQAWAKDYNFVYQMGSGNSVLTSNLVLQYYNGVASLKIENVNEQSLCASGFDITADLAMFIPEAGHQGEAISNEIGLSTDSAQEVLRIVGFDSQAGSETLFSLHGTARYEAGQVTVLSSEVALQIRQTVQEILGDAIDAGEFSPCPIEVAPRLPDNPLPFVDGPRLPDEPCAVGQPCLPTNPLPVAQ